MGRVETGEIGEVRPKLKNIRHIIQAPVQCE